MHGVVELGTFTASAKKAGVTADEVDAIVNLLSETPQAGEVMVGTGGARKIRFAKPGSGKSGGYRVITFYAAADIPVMLLDIYGKGDKVNLTKGERNALAKVLGQIESAYRASTKAAAEAMKAKRAERQMTEAGKRLLAAANEALAFAKGEAVPGSYKIYAPPPTVDVKAIRGKMGMTQAEFGARFGFGKARIRDWEQERTRPAASDRVLLVTIDSDPDSVLRALEMHGAKSLEPTPSIEGAELIHATTYRKAAAERAVAVVTGTSRRKPMKAHATKPKSARAVAHKGAAG